MEERTTEFKRNSRYHSIDPDIESLRGKLSAVLKEVQEQIAREQDSLSSARTPLVPEIVVKTTPSSSHRLRITLPKFDGNPLEWKRFSRLFTTVIAKDEALTDGEKACLLLEAMSTPETKKVVHTASQGSDGYELSLKAL